MVEVALLTVTVEKMTVVLVGELKVETTISRKKEVYHLNLDGEKNSRRLNLEPAESSKMRNLEGATNPRKINLDGAKSFKRAPSSFHEKSHHNDENL